MHTNNVLSFLAEDFPRVHSSRDDYQGSKGAKAKAKAKAQGAAAGAGEGGSGGAGAGGKSGGGGGAKAKPPSEAQRKAAEGSSKLTSFFGAKPAAGAEV